MKKFALVLTLLGCACSRAGSNNADATTSIDASSIDADPSAPDANSTPDADTSGPDASSAGLIINEILLDQFGDDNNEFVEIKGSPNTDYSAFSVLQIDGDEGGGEVGWVLTETTLGTTDANGYYVANVAANTFQNGSQTLLLVLDFSGSLDQDLDTDDNGTIDVTPWVELVDAVAIDDGAGVNYTYAGSATLDKTTATGNPTAFGGASRIPDGTDTDAAGDWTSNTPMFNNSGIATGEARNTPGAANTVEP